MTARAIRKSGEPPAQHSPVLLPSRPFPVQAKKKMSGPTTLDEPEQESRNTQSTLAPGPSFGDISIFSQESSPNGTGNGLPGPLRQKMERAFSSDFADVRVHANTPDAKSLSALAFTQGKDIHFAPGQYNPASQEGQKIIAHELTHVVQQRQGKVAVPGSQGVPVNADPKLEAEADALGEQALRGNALAIGSTSQSNKSQQPGSKAVQLQPDDEEEPGEQTSVYQPTNRELRSAKQNLKKTTGMSTMYPHVNITRGGKHASDAHDDPMKFLEFATQTRRDMTNLSATESGREIFDTIGDAGHQVTLQDRGVNAAHGGSHRAHNTAGASTPGVGSDSTVTHQPDRSVLAPRPHAAPTSSTLSLGHELIHSTHSATGTLQSGVHSESGVKNEERHTVGNPSGKRPTSGAPTENILRAELAEQYQNISGSEGEPIPRTKYGTNDLGFNPEDDQY